MVPTVVAVKDGRIVDRIAVYMTLVGVIQVEAVPTVLAVKDGRIVDRFVGLKDDDVLQSFVEKLTV